MLVIRPAQLEILSRNRQNAFERIMCNELSNSFPSLCDQYSLGPLVEFVRSGIEKARSYGIFREGDVRRFLLCMAYLGPDFDKTPRHSQTRMWLLAPEYDGTGKMDRIYDYLMFSEPSV